MLTYSSAVGGLPNSWKRFRAVQLRNRRLLDRQTTILTTNCADEILAGQQVRDGHRALSQMAQSGHGGVIERVLVFRAGVVADAVRVSVGEFYAVGVSGGTRMPPKCISEVYRPTNVVSWPPCAVWLEVNAA